MASVVYVPGISLTSKAWLRADALGRPAVCLNVGDVAVLDMFLLHRFVDRRVQLHLLREETQLRNNFVSGK